jgi:ZIP family zinc transporter
MEPILLILICSLIAGLATGIGGFVVLFKKPSRKIFGFLIGVASGVMISLSFLALLGEAWKSVGFLLATISFAFGAIFMFLLDFLTPHIRFNVKESCDKKLFKTGILTTIGIALHNLPEGIAIGIGFTHMPSFGFLIAIAIALHNIPEGIATALPLYESGISKIKTFMITLFSGLVEPIGAILAILFLWGKGAIIAPALAFAAGVMVFITLDELIPCAKDRHEHSTALGIIIGSVVMMILYGIFGV